jgi:Domain of unknown function (DUF5658)
LSEEVLSTRKGEGDYMLKAEIIPTALLIIMGSIDCLTTVIGVLYSGKTELNPFLAGIISTNIGAFLVIKLAATITIASTFILAHKTLMKTENKTTKSFTYFSKLIKIAYSGLLIFLVIVIINNLLVLLL